MHLHNRVALQGCRHIKPPHLSSALVDGKTAPVEIVFAQTQPLMALLWLTGHWRFVCLAWIACLSSYGGDAHALELDIQKKTAAISSGLKFKPWSLGRN